MRAGVGARAVEHAHPKGVSDALRRRVRGSSLTQHRRDGQVEHLGAQSGLDLRGVQKPLVRQSTQQIEDNRGAVRTATECDGAHVDLTTQAPIDFGVRYARHQALHRRVELEDIRFCPVDQREIPRLKDDLSVALACNAAPLDLKRQKVVTTAVERNVLARALDDNRIASNVGELKRPEPRGTDLRMVRTVARTSRAKASDGRADRFLKVAKLAAGLDPMGGQVCVHGIDSRAVRARCEGQVTRSGSVESSVPGSPDGRGDSKGTPPAALAALDQACRAAAQSEGFRKQLETMNTPVHYMDGKTFDTFIKSEFERNGRLLREAGIEKE